MQLIRIVVLLLLLAAGVYFAYYAATGQERFKSSGLRLLKWGVAVGLVFFSVLILEQFL